ncbi:4-hydroxy-tetrahydrodipicolinate synthase [Desulfobacter hydrogenophilus]|uniref:4-hydroxy-tetrahydrodipicolinate synthase n=1 Tax=Desulfobacter hydrogenophilus TaxID=2291 RepID=A0A328FD04_9BACT|nr:4-hydroxy-tetrahydrodipicolinate synthase [Desulfobacter hydrogenophilus]NDY72567.1 4-hydroxy-tetrahydrodipicolinate synthase [Desulfobacter hydrogenophilus]QBH13290.1 4-hydroxy-tetrahydrodipicolinate synthase [Desulfobacter hydrogenophilus]RAM01312.1 4-hydroxy-tetrahydrodipicolinate synthase [Desulfobacter hydrogenophilus]
MEHGCYTALITPFTPAGDLDRDGLSGLIDFQIENQITGILATGTTGESPTFKWEEHNLVIDLTTKQTRNKCKCIAGTGSNNTNEALTGTSHAAEQGVDGVLLVDPYYNGPSSLEIRREYYEVVAKETPGLEIIPYIIPGRTGAQMLPQDLAILADNCANVKSVKEATGNMDNMKLTRKLCGDNFNIFSGDDALVCRVMAEEEIRACGAISVMSNIAPASMTQMVELLNQGKTQDALALQTALSPLLDLVVITTEEESKYGPVKCRARNPLPLKTMMQILGMPCGPCRPPLGKITQKGFDLALSALKKVQADNPEILAPAASFFNLDIDARLNDSAAHKNLWYNY